MNEPFKDPVRLRISAAWSSRAATQRDWQRLMQIKRRWVLENVTPSDTEEAWMLDLITNAAAPQAVAHA